MAVVISTAVNFVEFLVCWGLLRLVPAASHLENLARNVKQPASHTNEIVYVPKRIFVHDTFSDANALHAW